MLQDVVHPPEVLHNDDLSTPINAQMFEFGDSVLFAENTQTSEVASTCYDGNTSYASNISFPQVVDINACQDNNITVTATTATTTASTTTAAGTATESINNNGNLSLAFDPQQEIENHISASMNFPSSSQFSVPRYLSDQQDQFNFVSEPPAVTVTDVIQGLSRYPVETVAPVMGPPLPSVYNDNSLSAVHSFVPMNPSSPACSFLGPAMGTYVPQTVNAAMSADNPGIYTTNLLTSSELHQHTLDYQGENGVMFCPDPIPQVFNAAELQVLGTEGQALAGGASNSTPLASDITSLDDPTLKVGKLSVEQRKEKIHRFMKKRSERNFSKKIKYACRKTLADSRPRVRGRFAKNDDYGGTHRNSCSNHEEDEDDEPLASQSACQALSLLCRCRRLKVEMKEDDLAHSLDIFTHISGVNSFKCNHTL